MTFTMLMVFMCFCLIPALGDLVGDSYFQLSAVRLTMQLKQLRSQVGTNFGTDYVQINRTVQHKALSSMQALAGSWVCT